jgi:hydrogenase maturation protease
MPATDERTTSKATSIRVIGCGNPEAGDDAAGLLATRLAKPALEGFPGVEVSEIGPAIRLLDLLDGIGSVVVIDAVRSPRGARAPGELVRFEVTTEGGVIPSSIGSSFSSHGLTLASSIGLAAALGLTPRLVFLGIEVGDVEAGHPLSDAVQAAIPLLVDRITTEVARLIGEEDPS